MSALEDAAQIGEAIAGAGGVIALFLTARATTEQSRVDRTSQARQVWATDPALLVRGGQNDQPLRVDARLVVHNDSDQPVTAVSVNGSLMASTSLFDDVQDAGYVAEGVGRLGPHSQEVVNVYTYPEGLPHDATWWWVLDLYFVDSAGLPWKRRQGFFLDQGSPHRPRARRVAQVLYAPISHWRESRLFRKAMGRGRWDWFLEQHWRVRDR